MILGVGIWWYLSYFFCVVFENFFYFEGDYKNIFLGEIGRVKELIINYEGKKWRGLKKI